MLGVIALTMVAWALLWDRSRGRRRCPGCWYDMGGVPGLVCPECGRAARSERGLLRTRRRWRVGVGAVVLGVVAYGVGLTPRMAERGWSGALPVRVLMLGLFLFDDQADARVKGGGATTFLGMKRGTGQSRWDRLLIAHGLSRRLAAVDSETDEDLLVLSLLIAELGAEAEPLLPAVLRLAQSADPRVRARAIRALGGAKTERRRVTAALVPLMQDRDQSVVKAAAATIGQLCAGERFAPEEVVRPIENRGMSAEFVGGVLQHEARVGNQSSMRRMLEDRWWVWRLAGIRVCEHWSRYEGPLETETLAVLTRLAEADPRDEVYLRAREVLEESSTRWSGQGE